VILLAVGAAVASAYYFTRNEVRLYRSVAQMSTGFTVAEDIKLSDEKFSLPQIDVKFQNAIENIQSPKVLNLLSYKLLLHDLVMSPPFRSPGSLFRTGNGDSAGLIRTYTSILVKKLDSVKALSPTVSIERDLIKLIGLYRYDILSIQRGLTVNRFQKSDYINLVYVSENPALSAFAINTLCSEFRRYYDLERRGRSDVSVSVLDSLVKAKKETLESKVNAKNVFMSSAGVVDVNMEGSTKLNQVGNYENQLIDQRANEQRLVYRILQLDKQIESLGSSESRKDVSNLLEANPSYGEYIKLKKQYRDIYAEYIRGGSKDDVARKKLLDIDGRLEKLNLDEQEIKTATSITFDRREDLVREKNELEGELRACRNKIVSLQSKIGQLSGNLSTMASKSANIDQLDKEIEIAQAEYREANEKLALALSLVEVSPGTFKQSIVGEPAISPIPSKRKMIILLAGVAAFMISSIFIIGIAFFDNSIRNLTQFQRLVGLPVLGIVNEVDIRGNILEDGRLFEGKEKRDNQFRELLRKIRYQLESSEAKTILFTSTRSSQGKTSLIQAIAYSLSLSKRTVLIIDTNFCNNDLTKASGANPVLEEFSPYERHFQAQQLEVYVTRTVVDGVDIIGCRGGDYTPSEILPENNLLNYMEELKSLYDYILLEGAPLNTYTDTKELMKYVDGVVAVFSAKSSITASDKESIRYLNENREKFLGAILNKVRGEEIKM
jgi:uncharacterized protein involved in exopolysaccharide biosynthesis/Mrp family chromosome partitioning ATPase